MTSTSLQFVTSPDRPLDKALLDILRRVDTVARVLGIEYFVGGALARDLILLHVFGKNTGRATRDVDLGICVDDWARFDTLRTRLIETGAFSERSGIAHRLYFRPAQSSHDIPPDSQPQPRRLTQAGETSPMTNLGTRPARRLPPRAARRQDLPDKWLPQATAPCCLAEAVRFELTDGCPSPVFKTGAIDHSATLPGNPSFYAGGGAGSGRNSSSTSLSSSQPRGVAAMRVALDSSSPSCSARRKPGCRLDRGMPVRST